MTRVALLPLAALLGLAACSPAPPPARPAPLEPPGPPPVILDSRSAAALADLLRMEDLRAPDTALVAALAGSTEPEVRRRALLAAARNRLPNAPAVLLVGLGDPEAGVRAAAAFGLGLVADTAPGVVERLLALATAPPRTPADVAPAAEAAAALGRIPTAGARAALVSLLDTGRTAGVGPLGDARAGAPHVRPPTPVLEAALLAAWRVPEPEEAVAAVAPYLTHGDAGVRWRAAYALSRGGTAAAVPLLLGRTAGPDSLVRLFAVRGLARRAAEPAGRTDTAIVALATALADPHPHVRVHAAQALGGYGREAGPTAGAALLAGAAAEPDANALVARIGALGSVAPAGSVDLLARFASDPGRPLAVRHAAARALVELDADAGLAAADALLEEAAWRARYRALEVLAAAPRPAAEARLVRLLADPEPRVAAAALGRLAAEDSTGALRHLYVQHLGSGSPAVRAAALRALARRGAAADLPLFLDAYQRGEADTDPVAALAAVDALAALERAGIPAARAFFTRFSPSVLPPVVARVAARLGAGWGEPPAATPERPRGFYEETVTELVGPALAGAPLPRVEITVPDGAIVLELAAAEAPLTVRNFLTLVEEGYWSGDLAWHRVVPGFVLQDGDPTGTGSGGPGYAIRDEINALRYGRGTLGMALSGPDTGGGQWFITHLPQPHLDGGYTVFGHVVEGMAVADGVTQDTPILAIRRVR